VLPSRLLRLSFSTPSGSDVQIETERVALNVLQQRLQRRRPVEKKLSLGSAAGAGNDARVGGAPPDGVKRTKLAIKSAAITLDQSRSETAGELVLSWENGRIRAGLADQQEFMPVM